MGEGKYIGRRFIFVRFDKCPLKCIYCDEDKKPYRGAEVKPGTEVFKKINYNLNDIFSSIEKLKTPDLFAVSFTGGEPLYYYKFCKELNKMLKENGYRTFLESNGIYPERVFYVDIASIDIKLKEHFNNIVNYSSIYKNELKTIEKFYNLETDVYAKVVIMENTKIEDIKNIAKDLSNIGDILLCIQPVSGYNIPKEKLFKIMEACGEHLGDNVMFSIQIHKILGVL